VDGSFGIWWGVTGADHREKTRRGFDLRYSNMMQTAEAQVRKGIGAQGSRAIKTI
jgi:hypothetical protein